MSDHHPLGPSKLGQYDLCPPSYALTQEILDRGTLGEEAENRGTLIHEAVAAPLGAKQEAALDKLTPNEAAAVRKCHEFMEELFGGEWRKMTLFEQRLEVRSEV